ncbi:hypothetical protein QUF64_10545 [Anaerolineales bacterium HSG6]|nr:hypothetical protein [Anaerolineales bacterium HSG6]MDM8529722.1 hypothetical protein [Anaerolineales bacterium HSG25]
MIPIDLEENISNLAGGEQAYLNDTKVQEELFRIGQEGFIKKGRGVVVVDIRRFTKNVVRIYYLSAIQHDDGLPEIWSDHEMAEICQRYNSDTEVIVFVYFGEKSPKNDCYKLATNNE